ncbi:MAG: MCE family protein [Flavobacteriaceae bacterium]|nr:MCE family protein [Flavobacteriaceae bacterium]
MKITKEIKAGILVISSISLFIWGYSYLKGKDILNNYKTFFVKYDNVEGLAATAPITINGLVVGQVAGIKLQPNGEILVQLQIKNDFQFSKSSVVAIYEPGLIVGRQLQIIPNFSDKNVAVSGDTLTSSVKKGLTDLVSDKLAPLQQKIEKMVVNADLLLTNLNEVLDTKSKENLKNSISDLSKTIKAFNQVVDNANSILTNNKGNIDKTFSNLNKVSTDFSKISDSLSKANLTKVVNNLEKTLINVDKIMNDVQSGKGSLGKIVKDDDLYNNLEKTSKELELLLQDLRLNPTRYINVSLFGKKNKPYKTPNDSIKITKN